ncbi:MAG TPA: hypothetical protein PK977_11890 [Chitinophagaceae bacterium]|nr:hypothetical protein [Chitinophagaceae bacterium]HRF18865.1 hypothetical protein [Chitinophagaceae bacterium]
MKKVLFPILVILLAVSHVNAQWPSNVTSIESKANDSVIVSGDLASGALMEDLSWAANSSNACFPATQNLKFRGNHVLYATSIPPRSILTISVNPADANGDLSIYGYMMGNTEYRVVPNLPSCISCEADHKWDGKWKGKVQTSERKIEFQNPTQNTYNIVIGVAAPKDVITGKFNLKLKLKS